MYWSEYKTKTENNIDIDIVLNQTLQDLADCLFLFIQIKMPAPEDLNLKEITYQKVLSKILTSSSAET